MALSISVNKNTYIYGLLIFSIIVVIGIAIFLIKPLMDDNKKQQKIIDNRKSVITKLEAKKSKLEKASSEFSNLKINAESIDKAIPKEEDRKTSVYQLFAIADTASINLESINIDATVITGGTDDTTTSGIVLNSSQEHVYTINFMSISYKGINDFIDNANNALRLFDVKSITATGIGNDLDVSMVVGFYSEGTEVITDEQV